MQKMMMVTDNAILRKMTGKRPEACRKCYL